MNMKFRKAIACLSCVIMAGTTLALPYGNAGVFDNLVSMTANADEATETINVASVKVLLEKLAVYNTSDNNGGDVIINITGDIAATATDKATLTATGDNAFKTSFAGVIEGNGYTVDLAKLGTETALFSENAGIISNLKAKNGTLVGTNSGTIQMVSMTNGIIAKTNASSKSITNCFVSGSNSYVVETATTDNSITNNLAVDNANIVKGNKTYDSDPTVSATEVINGNFVRASEAKGVYVTDEMLKNGSVAFELQKASNVSDTEVIWGQDLKAGDAYPSIGGKKVYLVYSGDCLEDANNIGTFIGSIKSYSNTNKNSIIHKDGITSKDSDGTCDTCGESMFYVTTSEPDGGFTYNGKSQIPTITVEVNGKKLVEGEDYTIGKWKNGATNKWNDTTSVATDEDYITADIIGAGDYDMCNTTVKYQINPLAFEKIAVKLDATEVPYKWVKNKDWTENDGNKKNVELQKATFASIIGTDKDGNKVELTEDDVTVKYKGSNGDEITDPSSVKNKDKITLEVTPKGNYTAGDDVKGTAEYTVTQGTLTVDDFLVTLPGVTTVTGDTFVKDGNQVVEATVDCIDQSFDDYEVVYKTTLSDGSTSVNTKVEALGTYEIGIKIKKDASNAANANYTNVAKEEYIYTGKTFTVDAKKTIEATPAGDESLPDTSIDVATIFEGIKDGDVTFVNQAYNRHSDIKPNTSFESNANDSDNSDIKLTFGYYKEVTLENGSKDWEYVGKTGVTEAGNYRLYLEAIEGSDNYKINEKVLVDAFKIEALNLAGSNVKVTGNYDKKKYTYTGGAIQPTVKSITVEVSGKKYTIPATSGLFTVTYDNETETPVDKNNTLKIVAAKDNDNIKGSTDVTFEVVGIAPEIDVEAYLDSIGYDFYEGADLPDTSKCQAYEEDGKTEVKGEFEWTMYYENGIANSVTQGMTISDTMTALQWSYTPSEKKDVYGATAGIINIDLLEKPEVNVLVDGEKIPSSITASVGYDLPKLTLTKGDTAGTIKWEIDELTTETLKTLAPVAGENDKYTLNWMYVPNDNETYARMTGSVTLQTEAYELTKDNCEIVLEDDSYVYNGGMITPIVKVNGEVVDTKDQLEFTWRAYDSNNDVSNSFTENVITPGKYQVTMKASNSSVYSVASDDAKKVKPVIIRVEKAVPTVTPPTISASKTYAVGDALPSASSVTNGVGVTYVDDSSMLTHMVKGTFKWDNAKVHDCFVKEAKWTFTPSDDCVTGTSGPKWSDLYDAAEGSVAINVKPGTENADLSAWTIGSLSLEDRINMNLRANLIKEAANPDNDAYMLFTLPDGTTSKVAVNGDNKAGEYEFSMSVAAKEMMDDVKAQLICADEYDTASTFTVEQIAQTYLSNTAFAAEAPVVKAMLNYGAAAQKQFGYNAANLANAKLSAADQKIANVTTDMVSKYAYNVTGSTAGITFVNFTSSLNSQTDLKYFFKLDEGEDIDAYEFKIDNTTVKPVKSGDYYVITKTGIVAKDLSTDYTVTVTKTVIGSTVGNLTVELSVYSYIHNALKNSNSATLKDTCKALYWYCEASKEYFNNRT